jgi:hypothetical protein
MHFKRVFSVLPANLKLFVRALRIPGDSSVFWHYQICIAIGDSGIVTPVAVSQCSKAFFFSGKGSLHHESLSSTSSSLSSIVYSRWYFRPRHSPSTCKRTISSPASLRQAISLSHPASSSSILSFTFVTTCRIISAQNLVRLFGVEKLAVQVTVQNLSIRLLRRPLFPLRPRPLSSAPLLPPRRSQQLLLLVHSSETLALNRTTIRGSYPNLNLI